VTPVAVAAVMIVIAGEAVPTTFPHVQAVTTEPEPIPTAATTRPSPPESTAITLMTDLLTAVTEELPAIFLLALRGIQMTRAAPPLPSFTSL
jgi:hypothetical protein